MAANFIRKIIGSGSRTPREDENEEADDDNSQVRNPTAEEQRMQVTLSSERARPDHYWWDDKVIKDYVTWSFTQNMGEEYFTRWRDASHAQRVKMWTYFQNKVKSIDRGYDPYPDWQRKVGRRITLILNGLKYNKKRPDWVPEAWWEYLKNRERTDPNFAKSSKTNKANRLSGSKDGKALGTHTLGRKSCSDAFKELGENPTPYKLFLKTKKNKKGEWVNPRAAETDAAYQEEMSQPLPDGQNPDEFRAYYNAVHGFDDRLRVFGTGDKGAEVWFEPPTNRAARKSFSYHPTVNTQVSNLQNDLRTTQEIVREQQEVIANMQRAWAEFQASQPPPSCSNPTPYRRDDNIDDGHGFGSNEVAPLR